MFFRKRDKDTSNQLSTVAKRVHRTGYVFADIMNDLGVSAEAIMVSSKKTIMAYGYARRAAAAALYIQGLLEEEMFEHAESVFKSLQLQSEHSAEFQVEAANDAVAFMKNYSPIISKFLVSRMIDIAKHYDISSGQLSDSELFKAVLDLSFEEQQEHVKRI